MACDPSDLDLQRIFAALGFVTGSEATMPLLRQANKAACLSDITVLLEGETGTGKQVLAYAIHRLDQKRCSRPFVTVHCSTINETLAESELFGHERGAFSGAINPRQGLFRAAQGGTLFLDDVSDLPPALQAKLLDVLQRGVVRAVGADREFPLDVRIMATSNRPLATLVRQNLFRTDLYYRLNVINLALPPLRQRRYDLPSLILEFASRHREIFPGVIGVEPELTEFLSSQPFEGNVRELEHGVERALFSKTEGNSLTLRDWMDQCPESEEEAGYDLVCAAARTLWKAVSQRGLSYPQALRLAEKHLLEIAISTSPQTRRELASRLQTSERTLYHKIKSHGLTHRAAAH